MGRARKPLACSRCGRTPEEVKILSNRYCTDCMRKYNRQKYIARKSAGETSSSRHIPISLESVADDDYVGTEDI